MVDFDIFNVDTIIFVGFLIVNIVLGLTSSRGNKSNPRRKQRGILEES